MRFIMIMYFQINVEVGAAKVARILWGEVFLVIFVGISALGVVGWLRIERNFGCFVTNETVK